MIQTFDIATPYGFRDRLGEAPHWDQATGRLVRVDYLANAFHLLDPQSGAQQTTRCDGPVSFAIPAAGGQHFIVGLRHSVQLVDASGQVLRELVSLDLPPTVRLNDGKIDPTGALVFGTLSEDRASAGACYRLGEDLDVLFERVTISNGLAWDIQRHRFYYVDSWTWRIDVFDTNPRTGLPTDRRPFAHIDRADGMPDGLCVDQDGGVWVALFGGGRVRRYHPDGTLDMDVPLPVTYPTSLAFGGRDNDILFITSSYHRLEAEQHAREPQAGALLTMRPGSAGAPAHPPQSASLG